MLRKGVSVSDTESDLLFKHHPDLHKPWLPISAHSRNPILTSDKATDFKVGKEMKVL